MAIEVSGLPRPDNLLSYSSTENATPLDPGSNAGGFGEIVFTSQDWPRSRLIRNTDIALSDGIKGRVVGVVRGVDGDGITVSITSDSELGKFNVERNADPFSGSLKDLIQYYIDLAGIFLPLDYQVDERIVHVPGFVGNVWEHVKSLMSAQRIEMALVFDRIVVRPIRQYEAYTERMTEYGYSDNTQTSALAVDINYYNYRQITRSEVYPVKGEEPAIPSVEAGEVVDIEVALNASLTQVFQPEAKDSVGPGDYSGTDGVYTVVGQDNLPVKASQWLDNGGRVQVMLNEDTETITIRVFGAHIDHLAPFRIAMSAGGTDYNSLHITGTGVAWDQHTVRLFTGANPMWVSDEIGTTVDNRYISTAEQAMVTGQHTAAAYSGSLTQISTTATTINRRDGNRRPVSTQLRDVDAIHYNQNISTMADWEAAYGGMDLGEWSDQWEDLFVEMFANQVFGNVSGARVFVDGAYYRIIEATVNPDTIGITATIDTTIADFNKTWETGTIEDFNAVFENFDLKQFSSMPLWKGEDDTDTQA